MPQAEQEQDTWAQTCILQARQESENKKCMDCGQKGPTYICTDFGIFVCTFCSGVHREFAHRVKSIALCRFTSEEINKMQSTGNQGARNYWLAKWNWEIPLPQPESEEKIRKFIRDVYVNKKYCAKELKDKKKVKSTQQNPLHSTNEAWPNQAMTPQPVPAQSTKQQDSTPAGNPISWVWDEPLFGEPPVPPVVASVNPFNQFPGNSIAQPKIANQIPIQLPLVQPILTPTQPQDRFIPGQVPVSTPANVVASPPFPVGASFPQTQPFFGQSSSLFQPQVSLTSTPTQSLVQPGGFVDVQPPQLLQQSPIPPKSGNLNFNWLGNYKDDGTFGDFKLAKKLQDQEQKAVLQKPPPQVDLDADLALALKLQEEEDSKSRHPKNTVRVDTSRDEEIARQLQAKYSQ